MFKKINWNYTLLSAAIASMLFCICAFIFITKADYNANWILYVGSLLFFFTMAVTTVKESNKRGGNESTVALVFASIVTTFTGMLISVAVCFVMLLVMDSGFILFKPASKVLEDAPFDAMHGKTGGLAFEIFFAATFLCFFGGLISAIILPFSVKRNQTKDDKEPAPLKK